MRDLTTEAASETKPASPSIGLKIGYSTGNISVAVCIALQGIALFYFNQIAGVPAHLVSIALGIIVFIDALWDPLIGQWSDRTQSRLGRRHPFLYVGMILVPIAIYVRWHPPTGWSDMALMGYILATGLFMNLSTSLFDVPSAAMGPELVSDYHDRTVLMGYRFLFQMIGMALASVLIYGVFLRPTAKQPVGQLNAEAYGPLSIAIAIVAVLAMATAALSTRRRAATFYRAPAASPGLAVQARQIIATLKNRNFGVAMLASAFIGIGGGVQAGLALYLSTYFWEFTSTQILMVMMASIAAAPVAFLIAPILGRRFGKRRACMGTLLAGGMILGAPIFLRLMNVLPPNGAPMLLPIVFSAYSVGAVLNLCSNIMVSSMVADLVEDVQVRTGRRSEGLILSADLLPQKIFAAFSVVVPGLVLTWIGFPKGARPGEVSPEIISNLGWTYMPLMLFFYLASVVTWNWFRIDEDQHAINLERVAAG